MERSWLDTIQLLGLDVMVALILAGLVASALWRMGAVLVHMLSRVFWRRRPALPTSPRDVLPGQEWGPSR